MATPTLFDLPTCLTARVASLLDDASDVASLAAALSRPVVLRCASRPGLLEDVAALRWRDAWRLARVPACGVSVETSYHTTLAAIMGVKHVGFITATPPTRAVAAALAAAAADGGALRCAARAALWGELGPEPPMLRRAYRVSGWGGVLMHVWEGQMVEKGADGAGRAQALPLLTAACG